MTENEHWLASIFIKQREIIEAAETPFSKLAVFILPILAPTVPATLTGMHLFKLFLDIFTFSYADNFAAVLSITTALVLELLGYVGAMSLIRNLYLWIKTREDTYLVPTVLNGTSYIFYIIAMFSINISLGNYFQTPEIVTNVVGILSFITVPAALLAANHLNEVYDEETRERTRKDESNQKMDMAKLKENTKIEKYKLKYGATSVRTPDVEDKTEKMDWRKFSAKLTPEAKLELANLTPDQMREYSKNTGYTYKTISNWKNRARLELQIDTESNGQA